MKEELRWKIIAGLILVTLSLSLYLVHYFIFADAHHLLIFLVGDIAFIPFEVLIVTLIIDQMLESREKRQRMEKLNMVIGAFFSTLGTPLLGMLSRSDPDIHRVQSALASRGAGNDERFAVVKDCLNTHECTIAAETVDLAALRELLIRNEEFLLRIAENPMVFEHDSFTDLLLAVTHLTEELMARESLADLPPADIAHLQGDMHRVYSHLVPSWASYMEYLKGNYPYLFSLAMRKNPFDPTASVVLH